MLLALVRDLLFSSKITATARAQNLPFTVVRSPADLPGKAGSLLIAHLDLPGALDAAIAWRNATGGRVIPFVAHTNTSAIAAAQQAGLQPLTNGQFTAQLDTLLQQAVA